MVEAYEGRLVIYCDSTGEASKVRAHYEGTFGLSVSQFKAQVMIEKRSDLAGMIELIDDAYQFGALEFSAKQVSF